MNQSTLFSAQVTTLTRDVDELSEFYFAVDSGVLQRRLQPNQSAERCSGAIKDPDWCAKDLCEQFEWARYEQCQAFCSLKRRHFRHQFAKHDVQKSNHSESDYDRQNMRDVCCPPCRRDCSRQWLKQARQSWLADPTQGQ